MHQVAQHANEEKEEGQTVTNPLQMVILKECQNGEGEEQELNCYK